MTLLNEIIPIKIVPLALICSVTQEVIVLIEQSPLNLHVCIDKIKQPVAGSIPSTGCKIRCFLTVSKMVHSAVNT